jgi:hypothetical protein
VLAGLRAGTLSVDNAWLGFIELAARWGWKSPECRAFVIHAFERAAAGPPGPLAGIREEQEALR